MKSSLETKPGSSGKKSLTETTPLVPKDGLDGGDDQPSQNGGLSVNQVSLLIAGEMAGSGVLALPRTLVRTGWFGVPVIVLMCIIAAFSGKRLGDCWTMIEASDPEMRSRKRNPYSIIAHQALGKTWSVVVSMAMLVTLFGASVVYLLMAAQIVETLVLALLPNITLCVWYLIVAGAMTPLMLLATPKNFSWFGIIAFGATVVACILYFIQMMSDVRPYPTFRYGAYGFQQFFLGVGTIMFAFGGASTFPTIQNDMADKKQFNKSLLVSFGAILLLYLPIAISGYAVYGDSVGSNLAASITATPITLVANILMVIHLMTAFIIMINPVCQEIEELYNVPRDASGYRFGVRVSIMLAILFVGESIPKFYTILALVGGSSVALLTFILPSYCYLRLSEQNAQATAEQPGWMKMVCWQIITIGVLGGIAATISAFGAIFSTAMAVPCYLQ